MGGGYKVSDVKASFCCLVFLSQLLLPIVETRPTEGGVGAETGAARNFIQQLQLLPRGPAHPAQSLPATAALSRVTGLSRILPTNSRIWEVRSAPHLPLSRLQLPVLEEPVKEEEARVLQRTAVQRIFSMGIIAMVSSILM